MHEQIIYFGAPGTGKSYAIDKKLENVNRKKIFRVTIHPEFTYSDFIGQLLPEIDKVTGNPVFIFKEGPFTLALKEAFSDRAEKVYLVLEELSRGNVSAIFGDTFQLLDRNDLSESRYPIRNKNIADRIVELIDDNVYLPSNFNILCTVNTNDQSVFPMDTAFKRRFDWLHVATKPAEDENGKRIKTLNNVRLLINKGSDIVETNWQSFYSALNDYITDSLNGMGKSEDRQVGQFFIDFTKKAVEDSYSTDTNISNRAIIYATEIIRNKLLLYLWQDVQGKNAFSSGNRLFCSEIKSFDDLYFSYGKKQVFEDKFINEFLAPNKDKYNYS